jgi:hypothetical protein
MSWVSHVQGLLIASAAIFLLQGCGGGGGKSDDCKPMTSTDPCFAKCNPDMNLSYNCNATICKDLGDIGCKSSACQVMGNGSEAHCMSPMSTSERSNLRHSVDWKITKNTQCKPESLTGVYHDMHDDNNKIITVNAEYGVTIAPPPPQSKYYVDGVGQDWILHTDDVGAISFTCHVSDINFRVKNKPSPPPGNVTADWALTPLLNIGWVKDCGVDTIGNQACGQAGKYPLRDSPKPVFALAFGTFADAVNVWVKIDELSSNTINAI